MRTNAKGQGAVAFTHEGAPTKVLTPEAELRRTVMACMLWEDNFYEDGVSVAERIASLVGRVPAAKVVAIAEEARDKMHLRHAPLWLAVGLARAGQGRLLADLLPKIILRADELAEFLALYWKDGRCPLAAGVKRGLAKAFQRFSEYELAKYNRDAAVKLRDVLFLCHAKPTDAKQAEVWKRLVEGRLAVPDTWEVSLSAKGNTRENWVRLLQENKLGDLALLRNLRNMTQAGVSDQQIAEALMAMKAERVLPFRFITAARYAPQLEPALETAMFRNLAGQEKLRGTTVLLVDVSGSMTAAVSAKSEVSRMDAACGLAILAREICEDVRVFSFSDDLMLVPPRRGFALRDALLQSQPNSGTYLGIAVQRAQVWAWGKPVDRMIVISDEQSRDRVMNPGCAHGYMINVGSDQNGVGYGAWSHIDGWSEAVLDYLRQLEA